MSSKVQITKQFKHKDMPFTLIKSLLALEVAALFLAYNSLKTTTEFPGIGSPGLGGSGVVAQATELFQRNLNHIR